ncbi:MAG: hypothetical protein K2G15_03560 [Muribaculaceae bacterium]|nr:hypothetical protein [Muribaculaceae bacterium]MDE6427766.1 hypothetical protein [Muribaculaceae bacterium]
MRKERPMRNGIFFAALLMLFGVAIAQNNLDVRRKAQDHQMSIHIDSIMCREDVSRVYCKALGRPHTSNRIDGVMLDGKIAATDIDPIYFERAFQFEDEGVILLEVDFPALKSKPASFSLDFKTPYGTVRGTFHAPKK